MDTQTFVMAINALRDVGPVTLPVGTTVYFVIFWALLFIVFFMYKIMAQPALHHSRQQFRAEPYRQTSPGSFDEQRESDYEASMRTGAFSSTISFASTCSYFEPNELKSDDYRKHYR